MPGIDLSEQSIKMGACLKLISDWRRQDTYNNAKQKLRNWAGGFCVLEMAINGCRVSRVRPGVVSCAPPFCYCALVGEHRAGLFVPSCLSPFEGFYYCLDLLLNLASSKFVF